MKAIVQDTYGTADVLELRDIPRPAAGPDDVLVAIRAASVDPGVWHLMTGLPYLVRTGYGLRGPKVSVRGTDFAGTVEAVGANVTGYHPGDDVYGNCDATFAEYAAAPQSRIAHKPANLTFEQAAAVPVSAVTALQALRDTGGVQPGHRVLVIGAAGGVGSFAVQLAKAFGAHVTGVCGPTKTDLVRSLGADRVLDYTREGLSDGYDLIVDTAGNRPLSVLRRALTARGTLVLVGGEGGGRWFGAAVGRTLRALLLSPFVGHSLRGLFARPGHADLEVIRELVEAGRITPVVDRTYPLAEVPAAVRYLEGGHARGKIVVTV
ncbi:NAD(P)-dependent alcohol dehydrogenase [Longispora sp. K20-0274]|uniref:NAD(P)-dependent alcohol dehydrogenase n=1 Tax=Longispora sp. K20-0274 TaxID=3088255 RepID=UPI00399BC219